jgi:hypothetical protein
MTLLKISFLYAIFFSVVIVAWQGLTFVAIYAQPVQNSTNIDMIKIGDLLYSTNDGNVTNVRILDITNPIKTEVSFVEKGIINETIQVTNQGTYIETYLSNDIIRGEGKGIITANNDEIVTWQAYDNGRLLDSNDSQIYHGIIFFNSHSPGKLSFLDNKVGLYIIEIGDDGIYSRYIWEWR